MRKIIVGIVTTPISSGHAVRGIGVYIKRLLEGLRKLADEEVEVVSLGPSEVPRTGIRSVSVLHYPFFDLFRPTLWVPKDVPTVVTIHDVTPLRFPEYYPPGIRGKINFLRQKLVLARAKAVITDSETSRLDVNKYLGVPLEKIHTVPLASQSLRFPQRTSLEAVKVKRKFGLPEKYVLYVGDVNWNKNLLNLVLAAKSIKLPVVLVGKQAVSTLSPGPVHPELRPFAELLSLFGDDSEVMRLGYLAESELAAVYSLATVYCQPSWWEGFGLPVLEAMAAGCPVVVSNTPALAELVGEAAILVEPGDHASIASGLREALKSEVAERLVKMGRVRAKQFSWNKTAKKTLEVYRAVSNA